MKHITLEQAKQLKVGTILYHTQNKHADDSPQRWKVNGKVKLWKRNPEKVQVPVKNGLRNCGYVREFDLHLVSLLEEDITMCKMFYFVSDARRCQRQKRKEGFKTKMDAHEAICHPFFIIEWKPKKVFKINPETDEIADDDLIAAADYYDNLKNK